MAIRVVCPTCAKSLTAPDAAAGKQAPCPACKTKILVPAAPASVTPTAQTPTAVKPAVAKAPAAQPKPTPSPSAQAPTAQPRTGQAAPRQPTGAQPKPASLPPRQQPQQPKPAQPTARPAVNPSTASSTPAQPKRVPPVPPAPQAPQAVKPKAPPEDDDIDEHDIEIVDDDDDEISVAPAVPSIRSSAQSPFATAHAEPPNRQVAASRPRSAAPRFPGGATAAGPRRFLYLTLALAMIPLAISIAGGEGDVIERLVQTADSHPEAFPPSMEQDLDLEQVLAKLPDHRLVGAHLSSETWMHWLYAMLSAAVFLAVAIFVFEKGTANPVQLLGVGAATATFGIVSLLLVQLAASLTNGVLLRGNVIILIVFYVLKFIAFSYQCASDPSNGFLLSFFGYTFGVGLCEELTKAAPVVLRMRSPQGIDWRGACVWGLASGVGFGVAEGIMYSSDYYNGIHTSGVYLVRFVSCVALHAIWSAAVGLTLWHEREKLAEDLDWKELAVVILIALAGPMVLHGLYDTMLKRDMAIWSLATALASFVWLAALIEYTRHQEANEPAARAPALRSIR